MENIISYLKWRGDLNFKERSFCEADNLALAMLSYENLDGIVDGCDGQGSISVHEAYEKYQDKSAEGVLKYMAQSKRYADARLSEYCVIKDEETQTQFGAVCITLDSGERYISFRGTDSSIIGWKEDFSISYQVVRAQSEAIAYLEKVIQKEEAYYVGGHSKGGNLAVFASMHCSEEKQDRILHIFNNDGPGICAELLDQEKFERIQSKITNYIPEFCIIGRLFELPVKTVIVGSEKSGVLQHDGLSWQIEGDHFIYKKDSPDNCKTYNKIFDEWIESADLEQRKAFTNDFFGALAEHGRKTFEEVAESGIDGYGTILLSIVESESRTKVVIGKFMKSCVIQMKQFDLKKFIRTKAGVRAIICILLGVALVLFREHAIRAVGISLLLGTLFWSGKKVLEASLSEQEMLPQKRRRVLLYMTFLCLSVLAASHYQLVLVYANIVIGCFLCYLSTKKVYEGNRRIGTVLLAGILFILGIASLATPASAFWGKMITMGSLLVLYGVCQLCNALFIEKRE